MTSSATSHSGWSRRPSVDSIASTVDSDAPGTSGFSTAGLVATAAQKLKRLSQERSEYARTALGTWLDGRVECQYCFANLSERSIVFLKKPDSQNCCHFLHADCCSAIMKRSKTGSNHPECPKCKCEFDESHVVAMPHPFKDPDGWYQALDVHNSDRVPRERVLEAMLASLPIEAMAVKSMIWRKGALRGKLTLQECREVLSTIEAELPKFQRPQPRPPPQIEQGADWFAHWDADGVGKLLQEEATRALLKSFSDHDLPLLREAIVLAWQENAQCNPECADSLGPEAFTNKNSGFVALVLTKYQAAKYWKIWGSEDSHMENRMPRCLSCISESAF
jgi:hypothetical protein